MYVVGFLTSGHAISASCDALPINLDLDPSVRPSARAEQNARVCQEDAVCRCKVCGRCLTSPSPSPSP